MSEGDLVTVHFLVRSHGADVADSRKRGLPYQFKVGAPGSDPLLDRVVLGMRVGGTRTGALIAGDVYGPLGVPPVVFAKDLLDVKVELLRRAEK